MISKSVLKHPILNNLKILMQLASLVLLVFLIACSDDDKSEGQIKQVTPGVPVTVTQVIQKDVSSRIQAIGNVEAYNTVTVKPQIDGILSEIYFIEGREVKKRDLLIELDPKPFKAALDEAQAELAKSRAELEKAKADMKRYDDLMKKGIASKEQYDQIRTNLNTLNQSVKSSEAKVEIAKLQLDYCFIHSPIDGRIGKLLTDVGNVVKKSDTELVVINQVKPIYVEFSVPEQNLSEIKKYYTEDKGLEVFASLKSDNLSSYSESTSNQTVEQPVINHEDMEKGKLSFINNEVDTNTGTILLKAVFHNETERFWPGQFVRVELELNIQKNAIVIPTSATLKGQSGDYVFVVKKDNTVETRNIKIDRKIDDIVVVSKGLNAGDTVVTSGQLKLVPGAKVEIKKDSDENNNFSDAG